MRKVKFRDESRVNIMERDRKIENKKFNNENIICLFQ